MERRDLLKTGVAAMATTVAGCSSTSEDGTTTGDGGSDDTATPTDTPTEAAADGTTTTTSTGTSPYSVTMAPVGEVTFEAVPENWATYTPGYADMGVALGVADGLNSVGFKSRYHTDAYEELPGVGVDTEGLTQLVGDGGIDKELFLELDSDVHVIDPNWLTGNDFFGLAPDDIDTVESEAGPFIGNTVFRRTDTWHDYRYYTMYQAFEKVAKVFQREERYRAFKRFHDEFIARLQTDLPPARERPDAVLTYAASAEPEEFSPYRISGKGTNKKQWHDLGVGDALAGTSVKGLSESNRTKLDYETLLEVDPDVLLVRGHETKSAEEFQDTVVSFMRDHAVASELSAVQNDRVFRGGPIYEGPIQNLYYTERAAKQLYPDVYSGDLYDREELASIVTG